MKQPMSGNMSGNMSESIREKWNSLQARERNIVLLGAGLILLAACWLVLNGLIEQRANLQAQHEQISQSLIWMEEQSEVFARLENTCSNSQIMDDTAETVIRFLARQNQLRVKTLQTLGRQGYSVEILGGQGNNSLRFSHQLSCQGFELASLQIELDENEEYTTRLRLIRKV